MRNFKLSIDLADVHSELRKYLLREYSLPYSLIFVEADDPDDACYLVLYKLIKILMDQDPSIKTRILCKKIKKTIRIDKIISL
jgi:hypothetical protein